MHRKYTVLFLLLALLSCSTAVAQPSSRLNSFNSAIGFSTVSGLPTAIAPSDSSLSVTLPDYFYKHLTGMVGGKYPIVMNLTRIGNRITGDYYFTTRGVPLFFGYGSTITKDGSIHLVETNQLAPSGANRVPGVFDGQFVGKNELRGDWKKPSSPPLSFAVTTIGLTDETFDMEHERRGYYDRSHGSATMDVTYPIMRTSSAETDAAFNSNVLSTVVGLYENGVGLVPPTTVSQAMEDFVHSFASQLDQGSSRSYFPPWNYTITASVLFNSDGILSLRYEAFSFEGGAHPNTVYKNSSYLRATGSEITLDELLKPGCQKKLNEIGLREFRRERGIKAGRSLQEAGYFVSDKDFRLNTNFLITKAGLLFQFNQYEIAPYSFGAQQVLIPFSQLHGLLRPGTPIDAPASPRLRDGLD